MTNKDVVNEVADKLSNILTNAIYSNANQLVGDLDQMVEETQKSAQIVLKPQLKLTKDSFGQITIDSKIEWKIEKVRKDEFETVVIETDQLRFDL